MDSFVVLASDSNRQSERRKSTHRLYDIIQVTDHPEAYTAHDPCFDQPDQSTRTVIPLHLSVESHEREEPRHCWNIESSSNEGSLADTIVGAVQSIQTKIVDKLDTLSLQHKQAQKQLIIPSERIPVANDVIKAQTQQINVVSQVPVASRSVPLAVPREKVTIHLDQAKDLSAININQRAEFSKSTDVILQKPLEVIHKPLEVIGNMLRKPIETVDKKLHKSLDPHVTSGLSKELDSEAFDREFEATVV